MVSTETARKIALSLPGTEEKDHFGMPSFRAHNRIFATLRIAEHLMMVKLTIIDQSVFHSFDATIFYPVPNKWGLGGATFVDLDKVREDMLTDALKLAWELSSVKIRKKHKPD